MINYKKDHISTCDSGIAVNFVNNIRVFNSRMNIEFANKWPVVKHKYLMWQAETFNTGGVQLIKVSSNLFVANLICEYWITENYLPRINFHSLQSGLERIKKRMVVMGINNIAIGRNGYNRLSNLSQWIDFEKILENTFDNSGIHVIIYDIDVNNTTTTKENS